MRGARDQPDSSRRVSGDARAKLRRAFVDLLFENGYENMRGIDIARRAGVARSTFYELYGGKHGLLAETIEHPFGPLARAAGAAHVPAELVAAVAHVWEMRRHASALVASDARPAVAKILAEMIVRELRGRSPSPRAIRLVAVAIAEAELGVIAAWLRGEVHGTGSELAASLRELAVGLSARLA